VSFMTSPLLHIIKATALAAAMVALPAQACRVRATNDYMKNMPAEFDAQRAAIKDLALDATSIARVYVPEQSSRAEPCRSSEPCSSSEPVRFDVKLVYKGDVGRALWASRDSDITISCDGPPSTHMARATHFEVGREYLLYVKDGVIMRASPINAHEDDVLSAQEEVLAVRRALWRK
jgi:hypothetical protein